MVWFKKFKVLKNNWNVVDLIVTESIHPPVKQNHNILISQ